MKYRRMLFGAAGLFAACAVFAANAGLCFAEESDTETEEEPEFVTVESGDYVYARLVNSEDDSLAAASIESYSGSEPNLVIPSKIDGLDVVHLGNTAFADADFLETVTIPSTVTAFGTYTFADCNNLREFKIEGESDSYSVQDGILYSADGMTLVHWPAAACSAKPELPDGLESIGNVAFSGCAELQELVMPNTVEYIGVSAFSDCEKLEQVTLSSALKSIEAFAFNGCTALKSIDIPNTVTWIGDAAFAGSGLESIEIPTSVTSIGQQAFAATKLTEVTIPPSVTEIGYSAFGWRLNASHELFMDEEFVIHGKVGTEASAYATDSLSGNKFKFVDDYVEQAAETEPAEESTAEEAEETTAPADDEPVQEEAKKPSGIVIGAIAAGVAVLGGVIALLARPKRSPEKKEDEPEQKGEPEDE